MARSGRQFLGVFVATLIAGTTFAVVATAAPPPVAIVTGQDAGWPDVRGWDRLGGQAYSWAPWGTAPLAFAPYPTYQNGVRVAVGDVDGDGRAEIVTAPGKSAFTELRVFDGRTFEQTNAFLPFKDASWWNGAFVAAADTNGDGRSEIVEGLDAGCCTSLHVLDPRNGADLSGFFAFGDRSTVGARVTGADLNGDGRAEILAVPLGGSRVSAFAASGGGAFRSFEAFGAGASGGASIAAGDLVGDRRPELLAAASTPAGVQVKVLDVQSGATLLSLFPFDVPAVSVPEVAIGDVDGDGARDIVLAVQSADGTQVKALDASGRRLGSFYVLDPGIVPGASIAVGDLEGDGTAEIVVGGGATTAPWPPVANGSDQRVAVYRLDGKLLGGFSAYPGVFQGGVRVALADVDRDRRPEIVTAPGPGMETEIGIFGQQWLNGRDRGTRLAHFLAYEDTFTGGANVAAGDLDGDGAAEVVVAPGPGRAPEIRVFDPRGRRLLTFLAFEQDYRGGVSVAVGDLDADGKSEIVAGTLSAPARIRTFAGATSYGPLIGPFPPDGRGVHVGVADLDGTGRGLVIAGSTAGDHPLVAVIEPRTGLSLRVFEPAHALQTGIRLAGGDLDRDGRDEIVVSPAWGGDGRVRVFDGRFVETASFAAYPWDGFGTNVAVAARVGLPIRAEPRSVRLLARTRTRVTVARFRDAAGSAWRGPFRATIDWGDGTSWRGVVVVRGGGAYDVRSSKRYARPGRYDVTVTFGDDRGRVSIARGSARVGRRR